jgi:hypothetical protein
MFVQVTNAIPQMLCNGVGRFQIRIMERRPLQNQEPRLDLG